MEGLDKEVVVRVVLENCLKTMESLSTPDRGESILKRILKELSDDYPYLKGISISEGCVVIKDPIRVGSVDDVSLARSMNCFIHKSVFCRGYGVVFPNFRRNVCGSIGEEVNMKIRDAGILI
ncbi:MAG: hypothetical protein B6U72_06815 [Candidatus Altiarchaeales archaeon ex4484_2]|nr:MAG: hypothetical protein B6U72_06815 [Candidatus Altiarchaeales archaeon ex4484_2]